MTVVWRTLGPVFRHQWRLLVHAPLTYLLLAAFLAALSICCFLVADVFATDSATLDVMLTFLPWIALILVPALAMRAFVDRPGDSEMEFMGTLPVPEGVVVTGQFLAGSAVLLITLLMTAPFVATIAYLGRPDWGIVVAAYAGAALLLLTFYALALLAAALMREQVGSFAVGLGLLFGLMLLGWDAPSRLLRGTVAGPWLKALGSLSPKTGLDRMATGQVELSVVVSFVVVTALALYGAGVANAARRGAAIRLRGLLRGTAIVVAAVVALGLARAGSAAIDLTGEREFTLAAGTLDILHRVPDGTVLRLYWSESEAAVPPPIRAHARRVRKLLAAMAARSGGRARLELLDPAPDSEAENQALAAGLRRVPMTSGDWFVLGLAAQAGDRRDRIANFDPDRERLLEYDVAAVLDHLARPRTPRIGLLSSLLTPGNASIPREGLAVLEDLKRAYDVAIIPYFAGQLPPDLDALLVIDASVLKREMLYAIDQRVMGGMGLIVLMDPHLRMNPASDQVTPRPLPEVNDIASLLLRYGITYKGDAVVGDPALAALVTDDSQRPLSYPFWLKVGPAQLSGANPVTADLHELLFAEAGALEGGEALVWTTAGSGSLPRASFPGRSAGALAAAFRPGGGPRTLAAYVHGPFASGFDGPLESVTPYVARSTAPAPVFAVADVDWIFDPFAFQGVQAGSPAGSRPMNDNAAFLLDMAEFATGDPALIAIRSRGQLRRPFTRISRMFQKASQRYRPQEAALMERIGGVEAQIARLPDAAGVAGLEQLPPEVRARVAVIRDGLLPYRQELSALRRTMRGSVEALRLQLILVNLVAGPLLVLAFATFVRVTRFSRSPSAPLSPRQGSARPS